MTESLSSDTKLEAGKQFSNKKSYKIREEFLENPDLSDGTGKYVCFVKDCDSKFAFKDLRVIHVKLKHGDKISCPREGCKAHIQPVSMDNHLRRHGLTTDEKYNKHGYKSEKMLCDNCGKLISKEYLKGHKLTCVDDDTKEFVCEIEDCKKAFRTAKFLYTHKRRVHTQPIKCPFSDCSSYMKPASLVLHVKAVHEKLKEMRLCKKCGKQVTVNKYRLHTEKCGVIFNVRSFKCSIENCVKTFNTKNDLSAHVRVIHKEPIKCPHKDCDLFLKPKYIPLHIKKKHPNC